ncbi:MAG: hypothetical protein M1609_08900 [Firmicutes bacterium]|nr:hypothetical protein [Bacillota bacterium]
MGIKLQRVLTDNGKEYGSSEPTYGHYYGATCLILGIKHKTTKVKHPWTNVMLNDLFRLYTRNFSR